MRHLPVDCCYCAECGVCGTHKSVSARCAAGLSGCAPCFVPNHGHSASIPHAFAPAALRASLASRGKSCGLSPPRDAWRPSMTPNRLRRIGPASAPPQWARRWRTRWHSLRQVVQVRAVLNAGGSCPSRHEGRFTDNPPGIAMELPHHASRAAPPGAAGGVLACRRVVDLARVSAQAGEAFGRGCRVGTISFRSGSAQGVLVSL